MILSSLLFLWEVASGKGDGELHLRDDPVKTWEAASSVVWSEWVMSFVSMSAFSAAADIAGNMCFKASPQRLKPGAGKWVSLRNGLYNEWLCFVLLPCVLSSSSTITSYANADQCDFKLLAALLAHHGAFHWDGRRGSENKLLDHALLRRGCQAISTAKEAGDRLDTLCTCVNREMSLETQADQHCFHCFQA